VSGETDLEKPAYATDRWGSNLLLELAPPVSPPPPDGAKVSSSAGPLEWHADVPLHLRYLAPAPGGTTDVDVPWPAVFWACRADQGSKMATNPFDRVDLGYDGLLGVRTMFYHVRPEVVRDVRAKGMVETIRVPVLDSDHWMTAWLEVGTATVVGLGLVWVLYKLALVAMGKEGVTTRVKGQEMQSKKVR